MYATAVHPIESQASHRIAPPRLPESGNQLAQSELIQLLALLQTTLDPVELVTTFATRLQRLVPFDSWFYSHPDERIETGRGLRRGDSVEWELRIGDELLGALTLSARGGLDEEGTATVDQLIWSLVYPLRNAIRHQQAVTTAYSDPLTGARNRRAFDDQLQSEIAAAARSHQSLSLLVIDIDHFKSINDHFGHAIGDLALRALVETSERTIRDGDLLYRYGGEEFVILLRNTDHQGAMRLAERLRWEIEDCEYRWDGISLQMTASLGCATLRPGDCGESLFKRADAALYRAKESGRNRVTGE